MIKKLVIMTVIGYLVVGTIGAAIDSHRYPEKHRCIVQSELVFNGECD